MPTTTGAIDARRRITRPEDLEKTPSTASHVEPLEANKTQSKKRFP